RCCALFTSEKTKDNERVESPGDGSSPLWSGSSGSVESEKQDITDVEQLQTKKPDEEGLGKDPSPSPSPAEPSRVSVHEHTDGQSNQEPIKTDGLSQSEESNNETCTSEGNSKMSEKPPMNPSATLPSSVEDDSFGSRKARSSFGKGFFKIRGGKKTSSNPNLGERNLQSLAKYKSCSHV
ncbi:hypothetical protein XENOCAPTIV_015106, partial [Xenoophorus captivus]